MAGEFEAALSLERFARYLEWRSGDHTGALELYGLNTQLSESLYTPLQVLEVTLRNRIHTVLTEVRHERWFEDDGFLLIEHQRCRIAKATEVLAGEQKATTAGRIVSALTFSFWISMLGSKYERLWQKTLHTIARREDGGGLRRKDFSAPLTKIRLLRNRVAHHEPIVHWDLPKHYGNILQLTRWLSPAAADWCIGHSRFPEVYPAQPIALAGR